MSATALLVVDLQRNMFESTPAVADGLELLAAVFDLVTHARAAGAPVVWVRNCGVVGDPDAPGTPGWELTPAVPRIAPEPIVDKRTPNAFEGTNLGSLLTARGVRRVVVCGLQSEFCVAATCRGAKARGYAVTLAGDAVGTFDTPGGATAREVVAGENASLAAEGIEVAAGAGIAFG